MKLRELPFGLYEKSICTGWPWRDKFALVKDAGYDYLEIAIDGTPEKLARLEDMDQMREIRRCSEQYDLPLYTFAFTANRFFPLGEPDSSLRDEGIRLLCRACDFAAYVGARTINIAAYDVYDDKAPASSDLRFASSSARTRELFVEALKKCADYAAVRGVIISLETMDSPFISTTEKALAFVNEVDSPYIQIGADPANITAFGDDPVTDIPKGGRHVVEVEFKDALPGEVRDIPLGSGIVDFASVFRMLEETDYQGFLAYETWAYEDPAKHQVIYDALGFLKGKMPQI